MSLAIADKAVRGNMFMNSYMRSIGFRNIGQRELLEIYQETRRKPDHIQKVVDSDEYELAEIRKEIAPGMGLAFRGIIGEDGIFVKEYYYPYRESDSVSTTEQVEIVRESDKESFLGICDELRIGLDLVFFVQDMFHILKSEQRNRRFVNFGGVALSALALEGAVLLPMKKTKRAQRKGRRVLSSSRRRELLAAARDGDEDAYDELTFADMDTYTVISRRVETEDIYSIVETSFMPSGIENDKFSILGEILSIGMQINKLSSQRIYELKVNCNDLIFDVCINERDLLGEPRIGRRFKGKIWMQGKVGAGRRTEKKRRE